MGVCNFLMASLFLLSALFQFNDSDWYYWIPLYGTACTVNMVRWWENPGSRMKRMAKFGLYLGMLLFIKVSIEDFVKGSRGGGFFSLNMRERLVREKLGSGLVISSMVMLLQLSNAPPPTTTLLTKYGMPILVGAAYGLSFIFFAFHSTEKKY